MYLFIIWKLPAKHEIPAPCLNFFPLTQMQEKKKFILDSALRAGGLNHLGPLLCQVKPAMPHSLFNNPIQSPFPKPILCEW